MKSSEIAKISWRLSRRISQSHSRRRYALAQVSQSRASIMRKMLCEIDLEKAQGYPEDTLSIFLS